MNRICTICARGGSEGVPGKNVRPILGKPLIVHTLEQALDANLFDRVVVSSDSREILGVAKEYGDIETVERPENLATPESAKIPSIQHAVSEVEDWYDVAFDTVVDLDATAPVRSPGDVRNAVQLFETTDASNVITGVPARKSPYFNLVEETSDGYVKLAKPPEKPIVRRQDTPECFDMNASIYVWGRDAFFRSDVEPIGAKTRLYEMEEHQAYDIDSEIDFVIVEAIMKYINQ